MIKSGRQEGYDCLWLPFNLAIISLTQKNKKKTHFRIDEDINSIRLQHFLFHNIRKMKLKEAAVIEKQHSRLQDMNEIFKINFMIWKVGLSLSKYLLKVNLWAWISRKDFWWTYRKYQENIIFIFYLFNLLNRHPHDSHLPALRASTSLFHCCRLQISSSSHFEQTRKYCKSNKMLLHIPTHKIWWENIWYIWGKRRK